MVLNQPVTFGANTGIQRNFSVDLDKITGLPLYDYKRYYFAVTSYAVNPNVSPKVVEGGKTAVVAVPTGAKLGTKYNAAADDTVHATHIAGASDGSVKAAIIDPDKLTGDTYNVTFEVDTSSGNYLWNLTDKTLNKVVLAKQPNQTGDENYLIADGIKVYTAGPPLTVKEVTYSGTRWVSYGAWGLSGYNGAVGLGYEFFGSTLTAPQYGVNVELRFSPDTTSGPADGWSSKGYVFWRNNGYGFAGIGYLPFSAWDVNDPANPRQLNICFVENTREGPTSGNNNLRWDFGGWDGSAYNIAADPSLGGREYAFIMSSTYNPDGQLYSDANPGRTADVLYACGFIPRPGHPYLEGAFTMEFVPNRVNADADIFEFSTKAADRGPTVAKVQMDKINVVPNPYFGFNPAERTPTTRIVRFTNLPGNKATIRIFDLAGNLVRVIDDAARLAQGSGGTAYAEWDLRNTADVPVASGIYFAYIEVDGVGSKVLKVAIINREERLLYY